MEGRSGQFFFLLAFLALAAMALFLSGCEDDASGVVAVVEVPPNDTTRTTVTPPPALPPGCIKAPRNVTEYEAMKKNTVAHTAGSFVQMQLEDNVRMGGDYRTEVRYHKSYSMYRYENIPDELLGALYFETPRGPPRGDDPDSYPGKYTEAGKGMAAGTTTVTADSDSFVYVIAETGVINDADPYPYGRFDGGFNAILGDWTKLDVGPAMPSMFNAAVGEKLPDAEELHGPWAMFEVGGQARFTWRQTCFDGNVDDKMYSSSYLSVWRKQIAAGETITFEHTEFWTGGLAFQPLAPTDCIQVPPNSCQRLTADALPALMEKKTVQLTQPVTGRHAWYAASVSAALQAIVYDSGDDKVLQLLDDSDTIVKTIVVNSGGADGKVVGVKFSVDGKHLVVAVCKPPGATLIKYSLPDLTEVWNVFQERSIKVECATISSDYLSLGYSRYVYHHGGMRGGHQSDVLICFKAATGEADSSCREQHASHSQTMLTSFNPQVTEVEWGPNYPPSSGQILGVHLLVDAGDAFPEKMAMSVMWEPHGKGGSRCFGKEVQSGNTVFQGQRTHFGGIATMKKGGGYAIVASFSGQGTKFQGNGVEQPPKMFFGTVDADGISMTCMKPLLEENGQLGPKVVAISERRFLLSWTKTDKTMGNKMWGTDYGIDQETRDSGARLAIVNLYGQLEAEPVHLPDHPIPVEVKHLEEGTNGISWIYVPDGNSASTIQISRIKCKPMPGGAVPDPSQPPWTAVDETSVR